MILFLVLGLFWVVNATEGPIRVRPLKLCSLGQTFAADSAKDVFFAKQTIADFFGFGETHASMAVKITTRISALHPALDQNWQPQIGQCQDDFLSGDDSSLIVYENYGSDAVPLPVHRKREDVFGMEFGKMDDGPIPMVDPAEFHGGVSAECTKVAHIRSPIPDWPLVNVFYAVFETAFDPSIQRSYDPRCDIKYYAGRESNPPNQSSHPLDHISERVRTQGPFLLVLLESAKPKTLALLKQNQYTLLRGVEKRYLGEAHNLEFVGSNPIPATRNTIQPTTRAVSRIDAWNAREIPRAALLGFQA
jgi:hypothetical protein